MHKAERRWRWRLICLLCFYIADKGIRHCVKRNTGFIRFGAIYSERLLFSVHSLSRSAKQLVSTPKSSGLDLFRQFQYKGLVRKDHRVVLSWITFRSRCPMVTPGQSSVRNGEAGKPSSLHKLHPPDYPPKHTLPQQVVDRGAWYLYGMSLDHRHPPDKFFILPGDGEEFQTAATFGYGRTSAERQYNPITIGFHGLINRPWSNKISFPIRQSARSQGQPVANIFFIDRVDIIRFAQIYIYRHRRVRKAECHCLRFP